MDDLDSEEFRKFLARERRKGIAEFVFWTVLAVAMLVGAVLFSYYVPHMLRH